MMRYPTIHHMSTNVVIGWPQSVGFSAGLTRYSQSFPITFMSWPKSVCELYCLLREETPQSPMSSNANTTPGVKPPSGARSNFVDPPSQKGLIVAVAVLAIILSTLFVCLRIYTRRFINRRLWWDDCWSSLDKHHPICYQTNQMS